MSKCAFAVIHFGSNPIYLELELYFFRMLRQYTTHDIIYLYSVTDTPESFVDAVRPMVTEAIPYDDRKITYDVDFASGYANFNTLRTCNFIFAYRLIQYELVCIIESDMVIMKPIDSIFSLQAPAVLTYYNGTMEANKNNEVRNSPMKVLIKCKEMGRLNGGVMLIKPSEALFETYKKKIVEVVKRECKYPNETLFEYVNNVYYNLPIKYNFSHFLAKFDIKKDYGLTEDDIFVFHFNETKFKHIDIIKNPIDETGKNWLQDMNVVKRTPVLHYKTTIFDRYHPEINSTIMGLQKPRVLEVPRISPPKVIEVPVTMEQQFSPPKIVEVPVTMEQQFSPPKVVEVPVTMEEPQVLSSSSSSVSSVLPFPVVPGIMPTKRSPCPKGTRRNKKTGLCESYEKKSKCPEGTKRSRITGKCEPIGKKSKCPKGTHRNKKTGECDKN